MASLRFRIVRWYVKHNHQSEIGLTPAERRASSEKLASAARGRRDARVALATLRSPVPFLSLEQKLALAASDLKPDCSKVEQVFREDTFVTEQRELDQFLREQSEHVGKQLDEWLRKQKRRQLGHQDT